MYQSVKPEKEPSDDLDHLPLIHRRKLLCAGKQHLSVRNISVKQRITELVIHPCDIVKKEDQDCILKDVESAPMFVEERVESSALENCHSGRTEEYCIPRVEQDTCCLTNQIIASKQNGGCTIAEVGCDRLVSLTANPLYGPWSATVEATNIKKAMPAYVLDDLDHINLIGRRRMLLSRKLLNSTNSVGQDNIIGSATTVVDCLHDAVTGKEDGKLVEKEYLLKRDSCEEMEYIMATHDNDMICSSKLTLSENDQCGGKDLLSEKYKTAVKSPLGTSVIVKVEPVEDNELDKMLENSLISKLVTVKSEPIIADAYSEDAIDHMLLSEWRKLLASKEIVNADCFAKDSTKMLLPSLDCQPIPLKSAPPIIKCSRKRKKTATDSVEIALKEDAPGLLQVLVDKGVLIDEMKLYGQTEIDEAIDESFIENSFSELEAIISKLFMTRHSLLKLAPLNGARGEKTSYCLACLVSLVEQARYLQFRRWPVEWGWCRDLQSFIFVFKRHSRIVLERPEYGYATYFFELVHTLPIDWQIKRLVTIMKLTSCGRIALIENKALRVGQDLTEGEARVLSEYGWSPDTGLGTMLNYRDRVFHDRKNEKDSSEWRSKIGDLLMDGYNGGTIISTTSIPEFVDSSVHDSQIKLEM